MGGGLTMADERRLELFKKRFESDGLPKEVFNAFERGYIAYLRGETGMVRWDDVGPMEAGDAEPLENLESEAARRVGNARMGEVAWIILNGGLGTSMEMDGPKSLVPVKDGKTFLDLIVDYAADLRKRCGHEIPLILMNSFATQRDSLDAVGDRLSALAAAARGKLPVDFLQHRFPRIRREDGLPFGEPWDKSSWAPPGHGNIFLALQCSGLLDKLLENGYCWAFISNSDNLGAGIHEGILGHLVSNGIDFAMEVTKKTEADVKGGTLARIGGRLELLEVAQVPEEHVSDFARVGTFPVFNTNNIWINLQSLKAALEDGPLPLPLIINKKIVGGTEVAQLETAMGSAIRAFKRAVGILVPRDRFAPVKTTNDLLARRSDAYVVGEASPLTPNPLRDPSLGPPVVRLDERFYSSVEALDMKIPQAPSLLEAVSFDVEGGFVLGRGVSVKGRVRLVNSDDQPILIPDGFELSDSSDDGL